MYRKLFSSSSQDTNLQPFFFDGLTSVNATTNLKKKNLNDQILFQASFWNIWYPRKVPTAVFNRACRENVDACFQIFERNLKFSNEFCEFNILVLKYLVFITFTKCSHEWCCRLVKLNGLTKKTKSQYKKCVFPVIDYN